jgi:propanediol utilization protein
LRYGLKDKSTVRVRFHCDRGVVFGDARLRVIPNFVSAVHVDTGEANAANLRTGHTGIH